MIVVFPCSFCEEIRVLNGILFKGFTVFDCVISMVGRPVLRFEEKVKGKQVKDIMVGDDAEEMRNMLEISYPVDKGMRFVPFAFNLMLCKGIVQNWDDMIHLWDYTFERLGVRKSL